MCLRFSQGPRCHPWHRPPGQVCEPLRFWQGRSNLLTMMRLLRSPISSLLASGARAPDAASGGWKPPWLATTDETVLCDNGRERSLVLILVSVHLLIEFL